jgi:hypothetical protein
MKRILLGVLIGAFMVSISFLAFGTLKKIQRQKQISEKISKLPLFTFMKLTNESFSSSEIKNGPVLVVRFNPECEHCKYEISGILNSNIPLTGTSIILISSADPDSIKKFLSLLNYSDYPSVIPLADTLNLSGNIFGSEIVPSNFIYNKELELVKILQGEVKTETIIKYLHLSE